METPLSDETSDNDVAIAAIEAQARVETEANYNETRIAVAEIEAVTEQVRAEAQDPWPIISQLSEQVATLSNQLALLTTPIVEASPISSEEMTPEEMQQIAENLTQLSTSEETSETPMEATPESGEDVVAALVPPVLRKPIIQLV